MSNLRVHIARYKKKVLKKTYRTIDMFFQTDLHLNYSYKIIGFRQNDFRFSENQIAFVHVPKTGGASFYSVLGKDRQQRFINLKTHRPISLRCPPEQFKYITILRNPVDRVWSFYQMILRNPPGYPYQNYTGKGLEYFIKHCWEVRNRMCRYYTGLIQPEPQASTLQKAWKNMQQFYTVLSFDEFAEQASTFFQLHQIEVIQIPHKRKANYQSPNQEEQAIILHYNQYDVELFNRCKSLQFNNSQTLPF